MIVEGEYNGIYADGNITIGGTVDITANGNDGAIFYGGSCYLFPDDDVQFYALLGYDEESLEFADGCPYTEVSEIILSKDELVEGEIYFPYVHCYGIRSVAEMSVSPEELDFGTVSQNYTESPEAKTVTVKNTGNTDIRLIQPVSENYEISELSATVLSPDDTVTFTVQPKTGLDFGNYDGQIEIYADRDIVEINSLLSESRAQSEHDVLETVNVIFNVKGNYTLSFETGGGTAIEPVTKEEGSEISLSDYVTEKDGYTFTGWYEDENLTEKISSVTLDGNKTVYAGWSENAGSAESGETEIPTTSDRSSILTWIMLMFISVSGIGVISFKKNKLTNK